MWKLFLILSLALILAAVEAQDEDTTPDERIYTFTLPPPQYVWGECPQGPRHHRHCVCSADRSVPPEAKIACKTSPPVCYPCRRAYVKEDVCKVALDDPKEYRVDCD